MIEVGRKTSIPVKYNSPSMGENQLMNSNHKPGP